jgi:hypothetical protein
VEKVVRETLVALFLGVGFVTVALTVSVFGILKDKYWLVILGAILFTHFAYYLFGASSTNALMLAPPVLQVLSAAAVYEKNRTWAWILLAPSFFGSSFGHCSCDARFDRCSNRPLTDMVCRQN